MREKVEKEMREKLEKELKDKNKKLKNLTNNQVTNNFGKIILKIDNVKHEKYTIKNKTYKNWKTIWNNILFWVQRLYEEFQATRSENEEKKLNVLFFDLINQDFLKKQINN